MRGIFSFLLSSFLMYAAADEKTRNDTNIVDFLGQGIQKEIQTAKQPIDETIAYVGSSQCKHVKKLLGVSYEQLQGENEPDLNSLILYYKTKANTTIINITVAAETLRQARSFEPDDKLIIFVHGFTDDPTKESFTEISRSFIENGHVSSIALDGSSLIRWLYLRSTTYVRFMGQKLGAVLASMVYQGQDPAKIHIIGHSLGAHISGFAGKTFNELTGKLVGRISGLDPAGPCFSHVEPDCRLIHTDAAFVDVIHTDAGVYGIKDIVGHADYFPNSGTLQPNCLLQTCSHSRAWQMFGESVVTRDAFPAVKCKDWDAFKSGNCLNEISYMGYGAKPDARGQYFLQTGGKFPYGLGKSGIKYRNTDGIVKNIGDIFG
ncbi:phospholipase A1 VesT1.02-like [Vanessa tameamea]|uniref:Phospholipase A1 VesT1.02-like n=1 Tax=Vanessa tameamea TaxID=334116 RepID=A0A8B8HK91_VANTA|nr:phospholipase A1-like [Vanessa tameamea]